MSEPTLPILATGVLTTLLGPVLGPYALVIFGAVVGSLLAMSRTPTATRVEGVKFIAVGVLIALTLTGLAVWLVEKYTDIPGNIALMPLAFVFGASRNSLLLLIEKTADFLSRLVSRRESGP